MSGSKTNGHAKPRVTRAVRPTESGDDYARGDAASGFYFELTCGHRSPCETRVRHGKRVASPAKAEYLPCKVCEASLLAAEAPLPPCPRCQGRGELLDVRHSRSQGRDETSLRVVRCPACRGRTTNPGALTRLDLREQISRFGGLT